MSGDWTKQLFQVANWPRLPEDLSTPEQPEVGRFADQAKEWMRQLSLILDQTLLAGGATAAESSDALKNYPYPPGAVIYADADGALAGDAAKFAFTVGTSALLLSGIGATPAFRVATITAGALNAATIYVRRGDQVNGYAGIVFETGATIDWTINVPAGTADLRWWSNPLGAEVLRLKSATGQLQLIGGSAALPGLARITDPDTGIYWDVANDLKVATGGVLRVQIANTMTFFHDQQVRLRSSAAGNRTLVAGVDDASAVTYLNSTYGSVGVYPLAFLLADVERARLTAGGFMPASASGQDLGSTALEWANVYIGTGRAWFGAGQNASVWWDGTDLVLG